MATLRSPLGDVVGSFGNLTGAKVNGKNILRAKVGKNGSNTLAQQKVRHRFAELAKQFKQLSGVAALGFKKLGALSPYNRFVQTNYANTTLDPDLVASIDYLHLSISAGGVLGVAGFSATVASAGAVNFQWTDNNNGTSGLQTDQPVLVVVKKSTGESFSYTAPGMGRDSSPFEIDVPGITAATKADYAAYMYFKRVDGSDVSPSTYVAVA